MRRKSRPKRGRLRTKTVAHKARTPTSRSGESRRKAAPQRPIAAQSARNRFPGVVTRVEADRVAAIVEVQAGPHRLVSLVTAESVRELKLAPGVQVIAVVKATNVMIDLPS